MHETLLRRPLALNDLAGVVGHSFGGKVALKFAELTEHAGSWSTPLWLMDSPPGSRSTEDVDRVLDVLHRAHSPVPTREAFVSMLQEQGLSSVVARWLAVNTHQTREGGWAFSLDLDAVGAMLSDYRQWDAWGVVERIAGHADVHFVVAGRGIFSEEERQRLQVLQTRFPRVSVHDVFDAGHWLHVEQPDAVVELLSQVGPRGRGSP